MDFSLAFPPLIPQRVIRALGNVAGYYQPPLTGLGMVDGGEVFSRNSFVDCRKKRSASSEDRRCAGLFQRLEL